VRGGYGDGAGIAERRGGGDEGERLLAETLGRTAALGNSPGMLQVASEHMKNIAGPGIAVGGASLQMLEWVERVCPRVGFSFDRSMGILATSVRPGRGCHPEATVGLDVSCSPSHTAFP